MAKKMLFIFNPNSGKGMIKTKLFGIIDIFTKGGYDVTAYPTQKRGDLREQILSHRGEYDIITVSGGDGTLSEAAGALYRLDPRERIPIGYIPAGSTNDFAVNLGIPADMLEAAQLVVKGCLRECDLGLFNDIPFVYVAGLGAFTDVSYETPQDIKNLLGHSAYILEGLKRLPTITDIPLTLRVDDVIIERNCLIFMILNSSHVAGVSIKDFYSVDISDGIFEAVLIERPENLLTLEQSFSALRRGETKGPGFEVIRGSEFEIKTEQPVKWTLDGEFGGKVSEVRIKVVPRAVTFIGKGNN